MNEKKKAVKFLQTMVQESSSYSSMEMIEGLVEKGLTLENIPLQPLYLALKLLSPSQVADYLPRLSKQQRQVVQDLDLWFKDDLCPDQFDFWIQSFAQVMDDDVRGEFAVGESFLMYLKGRFNIWTFDQEDPQYPDHDHYFLSDDGLLLFEFDEEYPYVSEVRAIIREIYAQLGVENAYTWLFKMVSESALTFIEDEYQAKRARMSDVGIVDYFDALELDNPFINRSLMEGKIKKKDKLTHNIPQVSKEQVLPENALTSFIDNFGDLEDELAKINDDSRLTYLRFNFLRLVNGNIALRGSFRDGAIAVNRACEKTKNCILLGYDYLKSYAIPEKILEVDVSKDCVFYHFDFQEIFKIGNSLIRFLQGDLKKALRFSKLEERSGFLGRTLNEFIDHTLDVPPKACLDPEGKAHSIIDYETYAQWEKRGRFIITFLPYVAKLFESFRPLKVEGRIQDHFYTNYNVDEIDVEAILLSSFANLILIEEGLLSQDLLDKGKLGLTISEFKDFCHLCLNQEGSLINGIKEKFKGFKQAFGLENVEGFDDYFLDLLRIQLVGYDFSNLEEHDFAHVGGPIILKSAKDYN